jgi:hypothetical protein
MTTGRVRTGQKLGNPQWPTNAQQNRQRRAAAGKAFKRRDWKEGKLVSNLTASSSPSSATSQASSTATRPSGEALSPDLAASKQTPSRRRHPLGIIHHHPFFLVLSTIVSCIIRILPSFPPLPGRLFLPGPGCPHRHLNTPPRDIKSMYTESLLLLLLRLDSSAACCYV